MSEPAATRFPRIVRRTEHAHQPSQARYVGIAVFLGVVTAVETAVYYADIIKGLLITILVFLAAIKFATVASFFMHLRFDGRLLVFIFCSGLALAAFAFLIVLSSMHNLR
ncbi:MAG TPA: cytochrome C oxidase subunit IV family protein [Dehalococcoidia bacterium]|nr:cytochrome C oxidase subunit IV family protein [Dehalococcoidia bacterium]